MISKKNKAQIGVFIVIAVIIVIIGIFSISLFSGKISLFSSDSVTSSINQYMTTCIQLETQKAVNQMGVRGGWLYVPPQSQGLYASSNTPSQIVPMAVGINNFGVKIPYWFYYDELSKKFQFNIPDFQSQTNPYSMNNQIAKYIKNNIEPDCIKSFESFSKEYQVNYNPNNINVSVNFQSSNIYVNLNLPLQINIINQNNTKFISQFSYKEENPLKVPYYLSKDIVLSEANYSFVEKRVLQFLNPYMSTSGRSLLPPFYAVKLKYDPAPWYISNIMNLTKNIISSNINVIQFQGTKTDVRKIPSSLQGDSFASNFYNIYNSNYIQTQAQQTQNEVSNVVNQYPNYQVKTTFNTFYPFYFQLSPSEGNILYMPDAQYFLSKLIPFFITTYSTDYKMTFPVVFQIKNPSNVNTHFSFDVPIEANIDHNTPLAENQNITTPQITNSNTNGNSLVCNPSQFISGFVSLNISDPVGNGTRTSPNSPISGVSGAIVTFDCKGISTCYMGTTTNNGFFSSYNITQLRFRLPTNCYPGTLKIQKFGYTPLTISNLNPQIGKDITFNKTFYMYSQKQMKLHVKLLSSSDSIYSVGRSLQSNEQGFLIFKNENSPSLVSAIQINSSNQNNLSVNLAPGNYSIQGVILYNKTIHIPAQSFDGASAPATNLSSWLIGTTSINTSITLNDIMYNSNIIVPFAYLGIPHSYSDLKSMTNQENVKYYSIQFKK